jgi:hypothetical protein
MKTLKLILTLTLVMFLTESAMAQHPLAGKTYLIQSNAQGAQKRLLDIDGYTMGKNGSKVHLWESCCGNQNQKWAFVPVAGQANVYKIKSMTSNSNRAGKVVYLDVHYPELGKNGGKVQMWEDNRGTANQHFKITKNANGSYRIVCTHPSAKGASLDADSISQGNNGGKVHMIQSFNNYGQQEWNLIVTR